MTLQELDYFLTICQERSFSAAARKLFITQQGLSKAIANLEQELTFPLFVRGRRGVGLTRYGRELYPLALEARQLHQRLDRCVARLQSQHRQLRGGVAMGVLLALAPPALEELRRALAPCQLTLVETTDLACEQGVAQGQLDFGVTVGPVDPGQFDQVPLARRPMYAVIRQDNPLAAVRPVQLSRLAGQQFILASDQFKSYYNFLDYCRAHQFEPQIAATTMDMTVIYDRVVRNGWVGISADMPNSPLDFPGVALVPFPIQEFPWQLDLIFPRGRPRSPQEQLIREAFPRLLR